MSATLKDTQAARTALGRAKACAHLSLQSPGIDGLVLAPEQHQYRKGKRFGEWEVTGPSTIKRILTKDGNITRYPMVPVECKGPGCGVKTKVISTKLKLGMSKGCFKCRANTQQKAVEKVSWSIRLENSVK